MVTRYLTADSLFGPGRARLRAEHASGIRRQIDVASATNRVVSAEAPSSVLRLRIAVATHKDVPAQDNRVRVENPRPIDAYHDANRARNRPRPPPGFARAALVASCGWVSWQQR